MATGYMILSTGMWIWLSLTSTGNPAVIAIFAAVNISVGIAAGVIYDRVKELSLRDDLTSSYNRRFLAEVTPSLFSRAVRLKQSIRVTVIDCDDFKKINDENGHATGDTVLRVISHLLMKDNKEDDYVVRWGGDEFVLISCEGNDCSSSLGNLQRLNTKLKALSQDMSLSLSVSIGTAAFPEDGAGLEDLIRVADYRMYQSKLLKKQQSHS